MPSRHALSAWLLLLVLLGGSVWLSTRLFALRFSHGDVYPAYSSLRADPLGTKALFASLAQLSELHLTRNFEQLAGAPEGGGRTWLLLGLQPRALSFHHRMLGTGPGRAEMELDRDVIHE